MKKILISILFICFITRLANGQIFTNKRVIESTINHLAADVCIGDLNGDGRNDLVSVDFGIDSTISLSKLVVFNNSDGLGTFPNQTIIYTNSSNSSQISSINLSDLDADGDLDITCSLVNHPRNIDNVIWFKNLGNLSFSSPLAIGQNGINSEVVKCADFNGDSLPDIIAGSSNQLTVFINLGNSNFSAGQTLGTVQKPITEIIVSDLNNDGNLDILTNHLTSNILGWFSGDGTGGFTSEAPFPSGLFSVSFFQTADIDGDGFLDVVAADIVSDNIYWYRNLTGTGAFGNKTDLIPPTIGLNIFDFKCSDLDNDGDVDIVMSDFFGDLLYILNNGNASFSSITYIDNPNPTKSIRIALGDIDGDLDLDLISANKAPNHLSAYSNLSTVRTVTPSSQFNMDDCSETLVNAVPGSPNGALFNGTKHTEGYYSQSLAFDGIDDEANLFDSTWNLEANNSITYSLWVYPENPYGNRETILCRVSDSISVIIALNALKPTIFLGGTQNSQWINTSTPLTQNKWNHLLVKAQNGILEVVLNGVVTHQELNISGGIYFNSGFHKLGRRFDNQKPFRGRVDEVRIFNVFLTNQEAIAEYNLRENQPSNCFYSETVFYSGDNCDLTTAFDSSVNQIHGMLNGVNKTDGFSGSAFSFDGTAYIDLGSNENLEFSNEISITLWVKTTQSSTANLLIDNFDGVNWSYTAFLKGGKPGIGLGSGINGTSEFSMNTVISDGNWHHLAWTYGNGIVQGYLDGELAASWSGVSGSIISNNTTSVWIGGRENRNDRYYIGSLDEIKVFSKSLTQEQVVNIAGQSSEPSSCQQIITPNKQTVTLFEPSIYPNPSKGQLTLTTPIETTPPSNILISDVYGNKVTFEVIDQYNGLTKIALSGFLSGIHFLSYVIDGKVYVQKVHLQR